MRNATIVALVLGSALIVACDDPPKTDAPVTPSATSSGASTAIAPSASAPAAPKPTMTEMENASNKLVLDAWNGHDAKRVATAYAADGALKIPGMPDVKGREAITADAQTSFTAFPDFKVGFGRVWQKGNVQAIEWVFTGTNTGDLMGKKPTGRPVGVAGVSVVTFNDEGLIKEDRRYFDMTTTTSQLDAKAAAGSFRAVATLPAGSETHLAKDDAATLDKVNAGYAAGNTHKVDDIMAFMTDDVKFDDFSQAATTKGKKAMKDVWNGFLTAFPDLKQTNSWQLVSDGWVVSEGVLTGTHKGAMGPIKASNKPVTLHYVDVWHVKDGKIVDGVSYSNPLEFLIEIGMAPAPGAAPSASAAASGSAAPPAPKASAK